MGPSSFHNPSCQRPGTGCRPRLCLLKGCERRFTPSRPQSRYCGSLCAEAALRWRRVKASRCYRSGCEGRAKRREQNRHYRRRRRERTVSVSDGISELDEGKRPACASENFAGRMCARPGCYVVFGVQHEHSSRRFCSVACRLALRRVLDRESRYQQRRRRWRRQHRDQRIRPPDTS